MRAGASLGWRVATVVAFGATAALAVTLSRGAPMNAALASAKAHAAAAARPAAATAGCAVSGLRISLGQGARVTAGITRYPLDFTNVSSAPCTLVGYPEVTAYRGDGVQVGAAAGHDRSVAARRVLLAPGQAAHATLDASMPAARCRLVRVTGLRVVAPGQAEARYVRRPLTTCAARGSGGQNYLRVRAIQPGTGTSPSGNADSGAGPVADGKPSLTPARSARPAPATAPRHATAPN
jgi:hypothetical protein